MFQEELDSSQWPSPMATSLSLRDPVWSWGATTHLLSKQISSGTCSTLTKDSNFSWSIHLKIALFQTSTVLRLNLTGVRTPSTGRKHQSIGKTQPSTSVLWVIWCLGLQGRSGSLKDAGSDGVIFRKLACSLKIKRILEEFGSQRHLRLFFFVVVVCFTKEKILFS